MGKTRPITLLLVVTLVGTGLAQEPKMLPLAGDLDVHDPVLAKAGGNYFLFCTGGWRRGGILPMYVSPDLHRWRRLGSAIDELPDWGSREYPTARSAWAPDISFFNGKYHLYYALSSFGTNDSAIALATNVKLDPDSDEYEWIDQGRVVRSQPGKDDFNAIDANLVVEDEKNIWLSWGSFWGGIVMRRVEPRTGHLAEGADLHRLAARPLEVNGRTQTSGGAIEAPFLKRHGGFWYLFVSWDFCCRGNRSDYKIVVGRSGSITGPYLDREGKHMLEGGGTLIVEAADGQWRGAGHPAVYSEEDVDYLVFHAYAAATGRPRLQISTLVWDDEWPRAARLP